MENVNIGESEFDVTELSDAELAQKLRQLGANIGPVTSTTRAVYQRKLQRWLKYGPSHNAATETSYSHASHDESQLEVSQTQRENVISSNRTDSGPAGRAVNDTESSRSKSEHQTDSLQTGNRLASSKHSIQMKLNGPVETTGINEQRPLPVVSQEDVDLVERFMAREQQSSTYSTMFSGLTPMKDITREVSSEESTLRNRSSVLHVTPRPSLHSYKEDTGKRTAGENAAYVRTVPSSFSDSYRLSSRGSSLTELQSSNKRSSTFWIILLGSVVALLLIAVVYNMEPAYSRPLK